VIVRATLQTGVVGTGSYLVGHDGSWSEAQDVEVWLLVLFFPLIPLSRWRVSAAAGGEGTGSGALEVTVHSRSRASFRAILWRVSRSTGVVILTALPLSFSVWRLGWPWATPLLTALFGSLVGPGILAKVGMAIEMGVVLVGAALPILLLMCLDERTPRVPLRSVVWTKQ
jgi:hypothetical protein